MISTGLWSMVSGIKPKTAHVAIRTHALLTWPIFWGENVLLILVSLASGLIRGQIFQSLLGSCGARRVALTES
jgi:hypothetical protein